MENGRMMARKRVGSQRNAYKVESLKKADPHGLTGIIVVIEDVMREPTQHPPQHPRYNGQCGNAAFENCVIRGRERGRAEH